MEATFKASLDPANQQQIIDGVITGIAALLNLSTSINLSNQQPEIEEPISKKEICRFLNCSEPTMTKWMAEGKIPFGRKGRRVYFFKSQVVKSMEQPFKKG